MPNSFGKRARTRDLFSRDYRTNGVNPTKTYLTTFKVGDYVDIKCNPAQQKGMPNKFYHGRTGVVWNVTRRAIGVEINKQVNTRIVPKRIHVRIEHLRKSNCRNDFLKRVVTNEIAKKEAKASG